MTSQISRPGQVENKFYSRRLKRHFSLGFTLLELVFVGLILVLISALAFPQFRKTFNFLISKNFVFDIVSFARYAQAKAIISQVPGRLIFDAERKVMEVQIYEGRIKEAGDDQVEVWHTERSAPIPDTVKIDFKGEAIKFYPDGTADKSTIAVTLSSGRSYAILVEEATGRVKYEEAFEE